MTDHYAYSVHDDYVVMCAADRVLRFVCRIGLVVCAILTVVSCF